MMQMIELPPKKIRAAKYLDPASRMEEILFGVIMVLSVTLTAGLSVAKGKEGVRQLLWAAVGCNIAWGIIDGIMYVMNNMAERSLKARLFHSIRSAPDEQTAINIVREEVEDRFQSFTKTEDREVLSGVILRGISQGPPPLTGPTRADFLGGFVCFWLVFFTCLPAVVPFLIFSEPQRALRVSNFLLLVLLYLVGRKWAQYTQTNSLLTGLTMVAIGLALVGVAILLGG